MSLARRQAAPRQEFSEADISRHFRANGSTDPDDPAYVSLAKSGFQDWRLEVAGLVSTPLSLSLSELRALPSRTQITRHDCVEGWSCIGKWTGVPLSIVLQRAGLAPNARYIAFYCADRLGEELGEPDKAKYYESIDLVDAFHPQTILAYDMNGAPLGVPYGTPLRLRVERQLGYKMAKYVTKLLQVSSISPEAGAAFGKIVDTNGMPASDRAVQGSCARPNRLNLRFRQPHQPLHPSPPAALDAAGEALLKEVSDRLGKRPLLLPMPFTLWHAMARIAEWLPAAPLSRNKVELMEMDSTASAAMPWSRGPWHWAGVH